MRPSTSRSVFCRAMRSVVFGVCLFALVGLLCLQAYGEQTTGQDSQLRAVILLFRHGVRAPLASETRDNLYNAQKWPTWTVAPGILTWHGAKALTLLGQYYRVRYNGLLSGSPCGSSTIYAEAAETERTIQSTRALLSGFVPGCSIQVHHHAGSFFSDGDRLTSQKKLAAAISGRFADNPAWFDNAFAAPLAEMRRILVDCGPGKCVSSVPDFRTSVPSTPTESNGPVAAAADFAENFLLEYTEGLPMSQVGWGRVSRDELNRLMAMNTRYHDFVLRTPYWSRTASSNLARQIRSTILSVTTGKAVTGQFGTPKTRVVLLGGYDASLTWLGGFLHLRWLLPDQTFDATPPGSGLAFEIYGNRKTGADTVRVFFISQTLDQIRYLRDLNQKDTPSIAPVYVPGCSGPAPDYSCTASGFISVLTKNLSGR